MTVKYFLGMGLLCLMSISAGADELGQCKDKEKCPQPKEVCFNVVCTYGRVDKSDQDSKGPSVCRAAAVFKKWIDGDGEELEDRSDIRDRTGYEVECDDEVIFNNSAHRFTDHLGTRIQALDGPYPSILLPKGALRDEHEYVNSSLEIWGHVLPGSCYIYTGSQ